MKHSLQRWLELSISERLIFLKALFLLPVASLLLRFGRYQPMLSRLERLTPLKARSDTTEPLPEAQRTAFMVNAAAWRGVYDATCLRRSLVLWWLLRRRGIDSSVRIGVRSEEGEFFSHAWVEYEDTVINDAPDISTRFAPIL